MATKQCPVSNPILAQQCKLPEGHADEFHDYHEHHFTVPVRTIKRVLRTISPGMGDHEFLVMTLQCTTCERQIRVKH